MDSPAGRFIAALSVHSSALPTLPGASPSAPAVLAGIMEGKIPWLKKALLTILLESSSAVSKPPSGREGAIVGVLSQSSPDVGSGDVPRGASLMLVVLGAWVAWRDTGSAGGSA